jgi:hypothetical protein
MYTLEEELERQVISKHLSVHAITRTGHGVREWTYYAKNREVAENPIANVVKASPAVAIKVAVRQEPEWTSLHEVLSNMRGSQK